jgi:phosphatidylserine decarboxylase
MTARRIFDALVQNEALNFALTNRIPRRLLTSIVGRISKSERPFVSRPALALWQTFSDLDLTEAKEREFKSLHACFTRELREGARPVDSRPDVLTSPCDGIVVACGAIDGRRLLQVKGSHYSLDDLAGGGDLDRYRHGLFVTLRLTATMYHRFHAPHDGTVRHVRYIPGDVWNVNPPALARVPRLYCRNERALIDFELESGRHIAMIPVAAILVAGLRLNFLQFSRTVDPADYACAAPFAKGAEMGWFEHGSTIVVLAEQGCALAGGIATGRTVKMGEALLTTP